MSLRTLCAALFVIQVFVGIEAQDATEGQPQIITYEEVLGQAVASEFDRHVPALSNNLRNELSEMRNDINRQFGDLKHFMGDKLDRMQRDAPNPDPVSERSQLGQTSIAQSPEAMIRHNLAMAELRRLGADLTRAMNEEVGKLRQEFRTSLDSLRGQVENSTEGMASRLEGEFTLRAEESVNMLKKVFFLTRSQMAMIQSQLSNISSVLNVPDLARVVDSDSDGNAIVVLPTEGVVVAGDDEDEDEITTILTTEFSTTTGITTPTTTTTSSSTTETTTSTTTTLMPENLPKDCMDAKLNGRTTSGVTTIRPSEDQDPQIVWCDQETDGGGWTVMVRRQPQTNQLDFRRGWNSYRNGFGDPEGEYWIGLETLHQLTKKEAYYLRVDMKWDEEEATSLYSFFSVGPQRYGTRGYELEVGGYNESSTGGDGLEYHNGMDFSTYDEDNDGASGGSCAEWSGGGGWWYNYCFYSNPTGIYAPADLPPNSKADHFLEWRKWQGYYTYLSHLVIMIRPN